MKERIRLFLEKENLTSSQFAVKIGVQPSAVSHVLSGRNKASLDFVLKMLDTFEDLSSDWLLFGRGEMYQSGAGQLLFEENALNESENSRRDVSRTEDAAAGKDMSEGAGDGERMISPFTDVNKQSSERIIVFYEDGTYKEYKPR